MASVLNKETAFWPVDKVILVYLVFSTAAVVWGWNNLTDAPALLAAHCAGAALILIEVRKPNATSWFFRHWYPLPYVSACYKEMALLIPALRHGSADRTLANLDHWVWGVHPTVWLERIQSPAATEYLQVIYTLFVPIV